MNANVIRKAILAAVLASTAANSRSASPQMVSAEDRAEARQVTGPSLKAQAESELHEVAAYRAIYGYSPLLRYARIRANGVSDVFSVANDLRVER